MSNRKVKQIREMVKSDRAAIAQALQQLDAQNGGLRPSEVVAAAGKASSPLHAEFEWDDDVAGHQYRLEQARRLIRVIVIVAPNGTRDGWVHVPPNRFDSTSAGTREGVYQLMSVVVQNPDSYARALTALSSKVNAAVAAAEELREAAASITDDSEERMARITMAITALQTAGAAVQALH